MNKNVKIYNNGEHIARVVIGAIAILALLMTGAVLADSEPNNDYVNANALEIDPPMSGTISYEEDVDWYKVETTIVGDLAVIQTQWPPYIDTRIAIYGPDNSSLQQNNPVGSAAPGTYYIKVWSYNNGFSDSTYRFNVSLTEAVTGNDIDSEINDPSGAVQINLDIPVLDTIAPSKETNEGKQDVDWFTLTTNTVGDLTVTQTEWPGWIETRIAIYGPNNSSLQQNNPVGSAAPGTYYIKVWSYNDGSSITPYKFNVSLTEAVTGNDIDEGINDPSGAVPINLNVHVLDTIAPSLATAGKQDIDWYKIETPVVGDITIVQTEWPPYIDTRIALFGPNDPSIGQYNSIRDAIPGIYYIKVWSYNDGYSITPYKFHVNFTGEIPIPAAEPTPTPTPTAEPTPTHTPTAEPIPTPTPIAEPTPTPTVEPTISPISDSDIAVYDINNDGAIQRDEAMRAVMDYFSNIIEKEQTMKVIVTYFSA